MVRSVILSLAIVLLLFSGYSLAQNRADVTIMVPNYDVLFLGDIVDITTGKLRQTIPNTSITIALNVARLDVFLKIESFVQLKGESRDWLVRGKTKPFTINGARIITSGDLVKASEGQGDIRLESKNKGGYEENTPLRNRIEDYAKRFPTAPVGVYTINIGVFVPRFAGDVDGESIGSGSVTINIRNASVSEVQVTLIVPGDQTEVPTILPTFNWVAENPQVPATIYVFEMLPIHRSPQEAVNGIPHLRASVTGANTLNYPPNSAAVPPNVRVEAYRPLEQGKRYVWYITKPVSTNRGDQLATSNLFRFNIAAPSSGGGTGSLGGGTSSGSSGQIITSPTQQLIEQYAARTGGPLQQWYEQNIAKGLWSPSGRIRLDGQIVTPPELRMRIDSLINNNTSVRIRFE